MTSAGHSADKCAAIRLRAQFLTQTSRSALGFAVGAAAFAGSAVLLSPQAQAACTVVSNLVQCGTTSTVNSVNPAAPPNDRGYSFSLASPAQLSIDAGATISGFGLAIANSGTGGVTITNNGTISVDAGNTPNAGGIGTAALSVITPGLITYMGGSIINNGVGNGFNAQQNGAGLTDINVSGSITAADGIGIIVRDVSTSAGLKVTTGAVTASQRGIDVISGSTAGDVTIVANGDVRAGDVGITGVINGTFTRGNIDITAYGAIEAQSGIRAGHTGLVGIGSSVTVKAFGPITATVGNGIFASSFSGDVSVTAGAVSATGDIAILAQQIGGATAAHTVNVTANGAVSGTGGIEAINHSGGATTVKAFGPITATSGTGVVVTDTAAGGHISVTTAAVDATIDGIRVDSLSTTANVTIVANGHIGAANYGIYGRIGAGGTGNVDITANGAIDATYGIGAGNLGTGSTTVTAVGPITATNIGVFASSMGGVVSATTGVVTSTSNIAIFALQLDAAGAGAVNVTANGNISGTFGIVAGNTGTGAVSVIAHGTVTGTSSDGIDANGRAAVDVQVAGTVMGAIRGLSLAGGTAGAGNISVTGTGGFVGGSGDAANIRNYGMGTVTVDISGASRSAAGNGIVVTDMASGGHIAVTTGAVTALAAGKMGIDVESSSATANVTIVANGDVAGGGSGGGVGILGRTTFGSSGKVDITTNGAISGDLGIIAQSFGTGAAIVTAVGPVNTTRGGVFAQSRGGDVSISTGVVTSASDIAVFAIQSGFAGAGAIDVTTNGDISGTIGIAASNSSTGAVSVIANRGVTGTIGAGIVASGRAAVDVQVAGTVLGAARGLTLNGGTASITVAASGVIGNLSGRPSDAAIEATAGTIALNNAGAIVGTVQFAGTATFANSGRWTSAGGTSDFGGGSLTNVAGGMLIAAAGGSAPVTTTLDGLGSLTNRGLITMVDGLAGDILRQTGGNAAFQAGSVLAIDIGASGQSDRFFTTGTATLTGSTLAAKAPGLLVVGSRYTVVTADGGVIGTFGSVTGGSAFRVLRDSYDANNAYLDVVGRAFVEAGATPNQIATGRALDTIAPSGPLYDAVMALPTDAAAQRAFDLLSGEIHASAKSALIEDSGFLREAAMGRIRSAFGAVAAATAPVNMADINGRLVAVAPTTERFAVWGQGYGAFGRINGDGNAARLSHSTGGFFLGFDGPVLDTWRIGLMAGYSRTSFNVRDRASSGASDNYHLGAYAGTQWGPIGLRSGLAFTWHELSTTRTVAFAGFGDMLRAHYGARTFQAFGEAGYRIDAFGAAFEPFVNLAHVSLATDAFSETGGAAALTGEGRTTATTFTTLGPRASASFMLGSVSTTARGTLGWRHAFGAVLPLSTNAFAGGAGFTVAGVPIARDAAVIEAGLDFALSPAATLGLGYTGQIAGGAQQHGFKGNLAVRF